MTDEEGVELVLMAFVVDIEKEGVEVVVMVFVVDGVG